MILPEVVKEKDTIVRPELNYRELGALNCSMIKLYDTDPVKFFEQFKLGRRKKELKGTNLVIGDLVDFYLLDCSGNEDEWTDRFDEKFALFDGAKGSGQVFILADTLFEVTKNYLDEDNQITETFDKRFTEAFQKVQALGKYSGKTEDKALEDFNKNGAVYFQSLLDNIGKIVVDISLLTKAVKVADLLKTDEFTVDVFADHENEETFAKFPIEWKWECESGTIIDCKSEIDLLKVNHSTKEIYLYDLKTTYDNENFEYAYIKYAYYLQAAFYFKAVKYWAKQEDMIDYHIHPMEFIVGDTSANNRRPIRFSTEVHDLSNSLYGFSLRGVEHKGLFDLINEIDWAEKNDNWNCSKEVFEANGRLKLNLKYD